MANRGAKKETRGSHGPPLGRKQQLTLLGRGGAESARPFINCPFLQEKRGLEVPNFVTFPNSL